MAPDSDVQIRLVCAHKSFLCPKEKLILNSKYFEALYCNTFSDSRETTHTLSTDVLDPNSLGVLVHFISHGDLDPSSVRTIEEVYYARQAAVYLQVYSIQSFLALRANSLLEPSRCLSQARLIYSLSGTCEPELLPCMWRIPFKFYDLTETEDFYLLSAPELYWLLRNPLMVDPTGGIKGLMAIHRWIDANYKLHPSSETKKSRKEPSFQPSIREMCARLVFGLVEGLEEKISNDAPPGYTRRAVIECSSYSRIRNDTKSKLRSKKVSVGGLHDAAPGQSAAVQVEEDSVFEGPLPVTEEDLDVIQRWREDDNVFKHLYQTQNKCAWRACVTGLTLTNSNSQPDDERQFNNCSCCQSLKSLAVFAIDFTSGKLRHVSEILDPAFGQGIATYGSEILLLGGERKYVGSGSFAEVQRLDWMFRQQWAFDEAFPKVRQRGFSHCWRAEGELVILGGCQRFRVKEDKIFVIRPSHYDDPTHFVQRDTSLTQCSGAGSVRPGVNFSLQELQKLPESVASQQAVLTAVAGHVLLIVNRTLYVHCSERDVWTMRKSPITGGPINGFWKAFPYGSGIYLIAENREVYWLLVDPDLIAGDTGPGTRSLPPAFHAVLYGRFSSYSLAFCRIEDKLYCYSRDGTAIFVEALQLRYNPFEAPNHLSAVGKHDDDKVTRADTGSPAGVDVAPAKPRYPAGAQVTPAVSENHDVDFWIVDNPGNLDGAEVTPLEGLHDDSLSSTASVLSSPHGEVASLGSASQHDKRATQATHEVRKSGVNDGIVIPDILPTVRSMFRAAARRMIELPLKDEELRALFDPDSRSPASTHAEAAARRAAKSFARQVYPHSHERATSSSDSSPGCMWCQTLTRCPNRTDSDGFAHIVKAEIEMKLSSGNDSMPIGTPDVPISMFSVYDPVKILDDVTAEPKT